MCARRRRLACACDHRPLQEDVPDCLTARVGTYTSRIKWIEERREWITGVLTKHLLETA